jgi:replicative DNA helicase
MARATDISPISLLLSEVDAIADGAPARDTVPTGFPSLDRMLGGGVRRGDLVLLGGDVGSGKSSLALAMGLRTMETGKHAAFFTGEMRAERVMERCLAIEGRVKIDDLRNGSLDDIGRANVGSAAIRLRDRLPIIEPLSGDGHDIAAIESLGEEIDLVVVDSLQSLGSPADVPEAVRQLKLLAIRRNVAVLATAHLPAFEPRSDNRPVLEDFGALGAPRQHADVILGLYREEMYDPARANQGATELLVRKNRNGNTGYVDLYFYAQWMRFEDMLDPDR